MTAFNINEINVNTYPVMEMNSSFLETHLEILQIALYFQGFYSAIGPIDLLKAVI